MPTICLIDPPKFFLDPPMLQKCTTVRYFILVSGNSYSTLFTFQWSSNYVTNMSGLSVVFVDSNQKSVGWFLIELQ